MPHPIIFSGDARNIPIAGRVCSQRATLQPISLRGGLPRIDQRLRWILAQAGDGKLGVFVANASAQEITFKAQLDPAAYGMRSNAIVNIDSITPDGATRTIDRETTGVVFLQGTLPARGVALFRLGLRLPGP